MQAPPHKTTMPEIPGKGTELAHTPRGRRLALESSEKLGHVPTVILRERHLYTVSSACVKYVQ